MRSVASVRLRHKVLGLGALALGMLTLVAIGAAQAAARAQPTALHPVLGQRAQGRLLGHAVVGGREAERAEWPATGVLLYSHDSLRTGQQPAIGAMLCTATAIAPDVVVLAAHCRRPQLAAYPRLSVSYYFSLASDVSTAEALPTSGRSAPRSVSWAAPTDRGSSSVERPRFST